MPALSELFSSDYLLNPRAGAPSATYAIVASVYLVLLAAGVFVYYNPKRIFGHEFGISLARRAAIWTIALGAAGIVLSLARYLEVPILSARILVGLLVLATVALAAFAVYYVRSRYPARVARLEAEEIRKRYLPRPKPTAGLAPSRATRQRHKGKKRR